MLVITDNIRQMRFFCCFFRQRHLRYGYLGSGEIGYHSIIMCLPTKQRYESQRERSHELVSMDMENQVFVLDTTQRLTLGIPPNRQSTPIL